MTTTTLSKVSEALNKASEFVPKVPQDKKEPSIPDALMHFELPSQVNEKPDVQHQMEKLCVKKAGLTFARLCFLGLLSGVWMSLSASCALTAASGISKEVTDEFPVLPKLVLGVFAPVAMHFIVVFGGEFYSGNCMYYVVGFLKKKVTGQQVAYNLFWVFIWNALGCVSSCYVCLYLTQIFADDQQRQFVIAAAEAKGRMSWSQALMRSIPANILICTSIQMGIAARDMAGKILVLHFPLTVYTVAGFEHSITNLVVVPLGIMYGADVEFDKWVYNNLIPAAIGNFIGGGLIVGGFVTLIYSWDESGHGNLNVPMPMPKNALSAANRAAMVAAMTGTFEEMRMGMLRRMGDRQEVDELEESMERLKQAQIQLQAAEETVKESMIGNENMETAMVAIEAYRRHIHEGSTTD